MICSEQDKTQGILRIYSALYGKTVNKLDL